MHSNSNFLSATTLIGDTIKNGAGENLGELKEVMLDVNQGLIAYAVLSFGGFLGMGDKLFAVPWQALSVDKEDHALVLNVDKKTLETAPGFDKDHWPESTNGNQGWLKEVFRHYGYESS